MQAIAFFGRSLRIAWRTLAGSSLGFPTVVILSLALGVGFSTAIFSAYDAIYLKPLPVQRPQELALLETEDFEGNLVEWFSYPDYLDYRQRQEIFAGLLAYSTMPLNLGKSLQAERVTGVLASRDYFSVAGINTAAGRFFSTPSAADADEAVLSYSFWQRRFEADPDAIGTTILLNDEPVTIVGIAPSGFKGFDSATSVDVWVPLQMLDRVLPGSSPKWATDSSYLWLTLVGRLKAGVDPRQAQAAMNAFELSLQQEEGPPRTEKRFRLLAAGTGNPKRLQEFAAFLSNLSWAVAIILLVVCVNLCSLALARSLARRQEFAVRIALGASRTHLLGSLMAEALLLSLLGGALALLAAQVALRLLPAWGGAGLEALELGPIDGRTIAFALLPCLISALGFALLPALQAWRKADVSSALKCAPLQSARRRLRLPLRSILIIGQIALSLVLLAACLLLVRSLRALGGEEVGFEPANVLLVSLGLGSNVDSIEKGRQAYGRLARKVEGLPGVESVSLTSIIFGYEATVRGIRIPGYQPRTRSSMNLEYTVVAPGYFKAMEIPLLQGRTFRLSDDQRSTPVALINRAMKGRFWPEQQALGKTFLCADHSSRLVAFEVVGVVEDSKYLGLRDYYRPLMYFNYLQVYDPQMNLLVRTAVNPHNLEPAVRREAASSGQDFRVLESFTLADHIDSFFVKPIRRQSLVLSALAILAVSLAAGGVYGAVSYFTAQRRFEIGIRLALGAKPSAITGLVLRQAFWLALGGIAIGLVASLFLEQWLTARLYKVNCNDPLSMGLSAAILLAVAVAAAALPARSASRLDPTSVLSEHKNSL